MNWPKVKLGELVTISKGKKPDQLHEEPTDDSHPYLTAAQLVGGPVKKWGNGGVMAKPSDVLISWDGTVGNVGWGLSGMVGSTVGIISPDSLKVDSNFLGRFLRTKKYLLQQTATGATIRHIRKDILKSIEFPLLAIEEQRRIAAILDKADEVERASERVSETQDEAIRSVFLEMFGDPATNPKEFEIRLLKEFYIDKKNGTKCGPFGSALKKEEYVDSGISVWNMGNLTHNGDFIDRPSLWITEQKFLDLEAYSVSDGDVIISRAGTVGKMGVVRSKYRRSIISSNLIRVRFGPNMLPEYFVFLMTFCKGRVGRLRTGSDGSFTHMNTGILDKLKFPYPPIELQNQFADIVRQITAMDLGALETQATTLKASLTQELLA